MFLRISPRRSAQQVLDRVTVGILRGLTRVVDVDLSGYSDNIRHHLLRKKVAQRDFQTLVLPNSFFQLPYLLADSYRIPSIMLGNRTWGMACQPPRQHKRASAGDEPGSPRAIHKALGLPIRGWK